MKNLMVLTGLLLGSVNGIYGAVGGTKIPSADRDYQLGLGTGWDNRTEISKGECLTGDFVSQGGTISTTNFQQKISFDQLEKELGFGASGRAKFGVVEAKAAASFLSNSKSDAFSISASYVGNYGFRNLVLTNPKATNHMAQILKNDLKWEEACGQEFVQQLVLGAKIYFTIRIDFASELEKKAFEASFSLKGPLWAAEGNLKIASKQLSKRTTVSITSLQMGGETDKISAIYGNSENLISCALGEFDLCSKVLSSALDYATREFPKQISKETHVGQVGTGPAVISYLTKPYATAGIFPKSSPEVLQEVKRARFKLEEFLGHYYPMWIFANRYTQLNARRLSERQFLQISKAKEMIDSNIKKIVDASQLCYDDPSLNCIEEVNSLNSSGKNPLGPTSKEAFLIENETFAQFCDDGWSPGPYSGASLKNSIVGLMNLAHKMSPDAFRPPQPNVPIDECGIAGQVFLGLRELNASNIGLSDIRPLMEFTQLEILDLSDNQIDSLDAFKLPFVKARGGFKKLRVFRLHNNKVEDLGPLGELPGLEEINLSNNLILNADALKPLKNLKWVDLRNNSQDLRLTLPAPIIVLTADHGNSVLFMDVPRTTRVARFGHQAVTLNDGNVIITGGVTDKNGELGAELFDSTQGSFSLLPGMRGSRLWHTATPLLNGDILMAGGERNDQAEVYEPRVQRFLPARNSMMSSRGAHTATRLKDGRVLLIGGAQFTGFGKASLSAEIYDPQRDTFSPIVGGMSVPRYFHTATLLRDGKVLIVGGRSDVEVSNSADIFDPITETILPLNHRMQFKRAMHTATELPDGTVLIIGGIERENSHATAELYDPTQRKFSLLPSKLKAGRMGHQAVLTDNGVVLVLGGSKSSEVIDFEGTCKSCLAQAEIYDPTTRDFSLSNNSQSVARVFHSVSPIGRNRFLIVGGLGNGAGTSAEILSYTPPTSGAHP